ncbi:hypothetical protein Cgig2_009181 [Carnegiea gigantea]|uniref:Uncharacterized protein n=1 Tax=Carnegiea gigantea TaxID=171969 RepID=A0A9Q1KFB9_9CARY|nr:hypothetical protein Cgig2_009181 [Carnegiea gigantea]
MVTLLDETSSNRQYLCIWLNDQDDKETKLPPWVPTSPHLLVRREFDDRRNILLSSYFKAECLEDVHICYKDLMVTCYLFDALQASLCIYDKCLHIIQGDQRALVPEDEFSTYPQGEVSILLLDIHVFLRLPFSGLLYDEVVPLSKDFKTTLRRSCTHLYTTYHIL